MGATAPGTAAGAGPGPEGLCTAAAGTGDPAAPRVLLVHGLGGASTAWAPVTGDLGRDHRLLLVDLPGHGRSPVPGPSEGPDAMTPAALGRRLLALAVRLRGEDGHPVHLVGHSFGGWVALEAAARDDPADPALAGLVALAPAGLWRSARRRPPLLPTGQRLARWARHLPQGFVTGALGRTLAFTATSAAPRALPVALARDALEAVASAPGYPAADAALAAGAFTRAADVRVPVVVVTGARDRVLPPAYLRRELAPPGARWERWERCGHVPAWDRPGDVARLVRAHVAAHERGRGRGDERGDDGRAAPAGRT
ncbi:alpha/beta fold hydrolase [Kineococcus terrestris]|uniref:alpha/beta fold hydrolase n=1 Tax=Kineococcus terrestris TaxID=2044856 RepID=UPI0034DB35C6